jgi:hypothetical protein
VGADRLPQLPHQARRHHDGVRAAGNVLAMLRSPERVDTPAIAIDRASREDRAGRRSW